LFESLKPKHKSQEDEVEQTEENKKVIDSKGKRRLLVDKIDEKYISKYNTIEKKSSG
jgi:hypothetical protein